jgi:hypothetical protein
MNKKVLLFETKESVMQEMHDRQTDPEQSIFESDEEELEDVERQLSWGGADEASSEPLDGVAIAEEVVFLKMEMKDRIESLEL